MEKEIRTPRFANKIEVIGEKPGSPVTRSRSKRSVYSRFEPPPSAKFVCLLLVSFGISLASTVFAQDDPLPAATGNITSPARNLSADQATDARGVNTIGTHQRIPRQSSGSSSSAGTVTVRTVNEIDGDLKAEDGASVRIGDTFQCKRRQRFSSYRKQTTGREIFRWKHRRSRCRRPDQLFRKPGQYQLQ